MFVTGPLGQAPSVHRLEVAATDGGGLRSLANAEVTLSLVAGSERPPLFERARYHYSIAEDAPVGAQVGSVTATAGETGQSIAERLDEKRDASAVPKVDAAV